MSDTIDGYDIPRFTPTGRGVLVLKMDHIIYDPDAEDDELLETEKALTSKDFEARILARGSGVAPEIEVGDIVQIIPHEGQWFSTLEIDGVEYFLFKDNLIAGVFKYPNEEDEKDNL